MQRAERESEMAEADEAFHLLLAEASQNAAIRAVFQMLRPYIHTMMVQNVSVLGADGCTAHLKIVAAIEARNSELAKTHMAEHLNRSMEQTNMLNYVKKAGRTGRLTRLFRQRAIRTPATRTFRSVSRIKIFVLNHEKLHVRASFCRICSFFPIPRAAAQAQNSA